MRLTIERQEPTKEQLERWHWMDSLTTRQIAKLCGYSQPWVRKMMQEKGVRIKRRIDYPPVRLKGSHLTDEHRNAIAKGLKGNENWRDPKTGTHRNYQSREMPCAYCGKLVTKKRWQITKGGVFCGKDCLGKWNGGRLKGANNPRYASVEVSCAWCGAKLVRKKSNRSSNFFCNGKHNGLWKSANLVGEKVYNFKGGYEPYYGPNWRMQRKFAWERDGYVCQRCGIKKMRNPDVHHIKPFRTFGLKNYKKANDLSNLICLCNRCHKIVEEETNGTKNY